MYLSLPRYLGSDLHKERVFPFIQGSYKKHWKADFVDGIGYQRDVWPFLTVDYRLGYTFGRKESDFYLLNGWGDIAFSPKISLTHTFKVYYAFCRLRYTEFMGVLSQARLGSISLGHGLYIPKVNIIASVSYEVEWMNQQYASSFFSTPELEVSGESMTAFNVRSGVLSSGFSMTVIKPFSKRWTLIVPFQNRFLSDDVVGSPLVLKKHQRSLIVVLAYRY
ncbi:MAG: MipA/OmpV family protein [bacterium]